WRSRRPGGRASPAVTSAPGCATPRHRRSGLAAIRTFGLLRSWMVMRGRPRPDRAGTLLPRLQCRPPGMIRVNAARAHPADDGTPGRAIRYAGGNVIVAREDVRR